ncbi:MAG: hypothetical protein JJU37_13240 [Balneolaceae bacterium]|nr:hypothetical protein [Balneolaceae bacterium]
MKAIEFTSKTDEDGRLRIDRKLDKKNENVRVLILIDETQDDIEHDDVWLENMVKSPSLKFLDDPVEDIYTLEDGEPFHG